MKIAIAGKGGVGKTTLAAATSIILAERGFTVIAIDADPNANLASALGIPYSILHQIPIISEKKQLIEERTGARGNGSMFKLNPQVSDIVEKFAYQHMGVNLLVLGAVRTGGGGCACPESAFLRALVQELVLHRNECVVIDMEAGIEHLGRATARGVDALIVVTEPSMRSVATVSRITELAGQIGIFKIYVVLNRVRNSEESEFLKTRLSDFKIIAEIPYHDSFSANDRNCRNVIEGLPPKIRTIFDDFVTALLEKFS